MSTEDAVHISEDDLIQYALGTLKETQLTNLTAHISMCNECRGELARIQVELASYAGVMPLTEIPPGARQRFLSRLNNDAATESRFVQARNRSRLYVMSKSFQQWLETPIPLRIVSCALAAALAIVIYDDLSHIHQIRQLGPEISRFERQSADFAELKEFLRGTHTQEVTLHKGPQLNREPEGHTFYYAATGKLVFTASNMPTLPTGKAYELWILPVSGSKPVPAGTFSPDLQGNGAIILPTIPTDLQAAGFGVTVENEEGSPVPTSPIVLSGQ